MRFTICVSTRREDLVLTPVEYQSIIRVTIPIMYLPRSTPPSRPQPYLIRDPLTGYGTEEEESITIDLHSSNSARAALEKLQTSAQVLVATRYLYQASLARLTLYPSKAHAASTEDISFWGLYTPRAHAVVCETPLITATPRQVRFPRHSSYQEGENNVEFRG